MEKLKEELITIKFMIYSLYKSITLDDDLDNVRDWENECKRIAKEHLERKKKESELWIEKKKVLLVGRYFLFQLW